MNLKEPNKRVAPASPGTKRPRPARKLFQPQVSPLDSGASPLISVRRPRRSRRPLAVLAIILGLLSPAFGQDSPPPVDPTPPNDSPAEGPSESEDSPPPVQDVIVLHDSVVTNNAALSDHPVIMHLPEPEEMPPDVHPGEPVSPESELHSQPGTPVAMPFPSGSTNGAPNMTGSLHPGEAPALPAAQTQATATKSSESAAPTKVEADSRSERGEGRSRERSRRNGEERNSSSNRTENAEPQRQSTGAAGAEDFAAFRLISERNIFNPNRRAYRPGQPAPKPKQVDSLRLVGVLSYEKGTFAFFDGSDSEFRKVLKPAGQIAGYTVSAINSDSVRLRQDGKDLDLKVGSQLRREDGGSWEVSSEPQGYTASSSASQSSSSASSATPVSSSSGVDSDILKRLMQRREQE